MQLHLEICLYNKFLCGATQYNIIVCIFVDKWCVQVRKLDFCFRAANSPNFCGSFWGLRPILRVYDFLQTIDFHPSTFDMFLATNGTDRSVDMRFVPFHTLSKITKWQKLRAGGSY